MKYFTGSYIVSVIGFILAYLWGEHVKSGTGLVCVFIAFVLSVLEVSLSFDNAVVNAMKLEKMSQKWRGRFLTWGIIIAVFGMRFLFPLLVVSIFANIGMFEVARIALTNSMQYAHYLQLTHAPIVAFGGMFLLMLFTHYFFNPQKDVHWIAPVEKSVSACGRIRGIEVIISLLVLLITQNFVLQEQKLFVIISGVAGIIIYLFIEGISHWLEEKEEKKLEQMTNAVKDMGFIGFLYLELIDASFSLDGVLGAFALSRDIVIITIGLAIGAMFVRSLTLMLVEKKTLKQFIYLEHGAHWAIGALAILMMVSTFKEVPEFITGLTGLVFIISSLISSLIYKENA